jgi:hypothetical protein
MIGSRTAPASIVAGAAALMLTGCSGGADHQGLQAKMQSCGVGNEHFFQPEIGTIAATPPGDAVAGQVDPAAQECVLDWAKDHGFKVLTAEELQAHLKKAGAL